MRLTKILNKTTIFVKKGSLSHLNILVIKFAIKLTFLFSLFLIGVCTQLNKLGRNHEKFSLKCSTVISEVSSKSKDVMFNL